MMAKKDITNSVVQCRSCGAYFMAGVEGEGELCDLCVVPPSDDLPSLDTETVD